MSVASTMLRLKQIIVWGMKGGWPVWKTSFRSLHEAVMTSMMTSSNGNIFRVTGPLWGESTGDRWIPLTKASDTDQRLNKRLSKKSRRRWFEMLSRSLWRYCNYESPIATWSRHDMMTSSNGNIFRVTGHLFGEFTGPRWIPRTKAGDEELWCFVWFTFE